MSDLATQPFHRGVAQQPSPLNLAAKSMRFWLMAHKIAAGFGAAPSEPAGVAGQESPAAFLFAVADSSMADAGIVQGDKVVVDRSVAPEHGRLVVALVDGSYTLKRLFQFNGCLELRSENAAQPQWRAALDERVQLWGVVVGVIRHVIPEQAGHPHSVAGQ